MLTYRCVRTVIRGNGVEFLGPSDVRIKITRSAVSVERCRGKVKKYLCCCLKVIDNVEAANWKNTEEMDLGSSVVEFYGRGQNDLQNVQNVLIFTGTVLSYHILCQCYACLPINSCLSTCPRIEQFKRNFASFHFHRWHNFSLFRPLKHVVMQHLHYTPIVVSTTWTIHFGTLQVNTNNWR